MRIIRKNTNTLTAVHTAATCRILHVAAVWTERSTCRRYSEVEHLNFRFHLHLVTFEFANTSDATKNDNRLSPGRKMRGKKTQKLVFPRNSRTIPRKI